MYLGKSYPGSDGQVKGLSWLIRVTSAPHYSQQSVKNNVVMVLISQAESPGINSMCVILKGQTLAQIQRGNSNSHFCFHRTLLQYALIPLLGKEEAEGPRPSLELNYWHLLGPKAIFCIQPYCISTPCFGEYAAPV